jgi:hypothetical protein
MSKRTSSFLTGQTITFPDGTSLRAPFAGMATQWDNDSGGFRATRLPAQEDTAPMLRSALIEAGVVEQETIHLDVDVASVPASANAALRSPSVSETLVLAPPKPVVPGAQVVLYVDEAGGMSWHLPDGTPRPGSSAEVAADDEDGFRGPVGTVFTIATRTAAARRGAESGQTEMRGLITAIGRKVLKVLILPIAAELLAKPLEKIVAAVERKHSQNLIRLVNAQNYRQRVTEPFRDWSSLPGKRSMLIVHGIISSTDGMLSKLPAEAMQEFVRRYEGRVLGYDHFTLSMDPDANAAFFLNQIEQALPGQRVDFDILSHSRGGIVSRALVERGHKLVPEHQCSFRKSFFVATPNAGSALGNAAHIVDMVDVFTNFLTKLPDGTAAYVIEALLALLKIVAYTAETAIPGLAAMGTEGYIKTLNSDQDGQTGAEYGAAAADYDADPNSPHAFFSAALNAAADRTFAVGGKMVGNDLVVPSEGVYADNGNPMFPVSKPLLYEKTEYVYHNDFFAQLRTVERLKDFFVGRATGSSLFQSVWSPESYPTAPVPASAPAPAPAPSSAPEDFGEDGFRGSYGGVPTNGGAAPGGEDGGSGGYAEEEEQFEEDEETSFRGPGEVDAGAPGSSAEEGEKPALAAVELQRKPEIDFHERVTEGEIWPLEVRLSELSGAASEVESRIGFALAAGQESVEVTVFLSAAGFDVKPPKGSMTVRRKRDEESEKVTFELTAHETKEPIKRVIHADFFLANSIVGSVTHYTYVLPKGYQGKESAGETTNDGFAVPTRPRQECDWVVAAVGASPTYQLFLNSDIPDHRVKFKDMGILQLQVPDLTKYLDSILTKKFSAYPRREGLSPEEFKTKAADWKSDFNGTIEALGSELWQWLPQTFRDEYFALHRAGTPPRSISILSAEMVFPWELVIPNEVRDGKLVKLKRLGVEHVLGRWKPGLSTKPVDQMLKVRRLRVLNPNYPPPDTLKWAAQEAEELAKRFPGIAVTVTPADLNGVTSLFNENDVQLLHFSGHGAIDISNPNLNKILLEKGQEFEALKLAATRLCAEAQPVVYLNACSIGNVGETVGRAGGFASNFVGNGCSGVIAPLWPINDRRSMEFALALYEKLTLGRAIGEALQELRDENEDDPTYHAYTYFGDPWVRLVLPGRKAA